jgi:hypothetical protein
MNRPLGIALGTLLLAGHMMQAPGQTLIPVSGKICAFDPLVGLLDDHTDTDHMRIVIVDTGKKDADRFVKVEVLAFRKDPLPVEVYDGKHEVAFKATRSEKCDEGRPRIWNPNEKPNKAKINIISGSYKPTDAYDRRDLEGIIHLTCFIARTDK